MHPAPVLEFEPLRALLCRYVRSSLGRAELAQVEPTYDRAAIEEALADTTEAVAYVRTSSQPQHTTTRVRFDDIAELGPTLAHLRIEGATLDAPEIFELSRLLDLAADARTALLSAAEKFPRLAAHATRIADLRELVNDLRGKILPDGTLADHASVALARLRRDCEKQRHLIQDSLERFLRAHRADGTLQEDFVTIRNDRFVVPSSPAASAASTASSTEPAAAAQPSSSSLSKPSISTTNSSAFATKSCAKSIACCASSPPACANTRPKSRQRPGPLPKLELLFAKAEFAVDFNCVVPRLSPDNARKLILSRARHPLLEDILRQKGRSSANRRPRFALARSIERTLLISGPNTGGKTVALKTVGLLALMTHAGLPVPALEAEFPLFDQVLADIGDHQSLQESLSSFSSHILSISKMLEDVTPDSLVLSTNSAAQPIPKKEALSASPSRSLPKRRRVHARLHAPDGDESLRRIDQGVRNGSMGFDDATLEPTYELRLGAPGKSAGLDIASRLGLDPT